jgi:prepilin-type N-terminal cleavage/methylation domain-containing protein
MNLWQNHQRQSALTLLELLIVIAVLSVLCALLLPRGRCKGKSPQVACLNNLKQVVLGEIIWANDHGATDSLRAQLSTNAAGLREPLLRDGLARYYQALSNELVSPKILTCPSDRRRVVNDFAALNTHHLSYFLNMDVGAAANSTALHGDRQIEFTPQSHGGFVTLSPNTRVRWAKGIHSRNGDAVGSVAYPDGSVQTVSDGADAFAAAKQAGHRLIFP